MTIHFVQLRKLTSLNLSRTWVGNDGAETLAKSPLLGQLVGIDLSMNRIADDGARGAPQSGIAA